MLQQLRFGEDPREIISPDGFYACVCRWKGGNSSEAASQSGMDDTSDASARLVEEGLRRSEFAFLDFADSPAGRQAYMQGSTLAVWEGARLAPQL